MPGDIIEVRKPQNENKEDWKTKVKDGLKKSYEKAKDIVKWVKENPKEALLYIGTGLSVVKGGEKVVRSINRHRALRQEKFHREREVYDHSLNMMLQTKRKLRKEDFDRINELRRKNPGMRTSEAMSKLGLLK